MKRLLLCVVALAAMFGTGAGAQDLSGNWQGTLKAGKDLRVIFNFYKGDKDALSAKMYSIDQGGQAIPVTSVTEHGSSIKISVDMIGGTFEGKLSEDGKTITGTWTQGTQPLPLTLVRTTPETAWDIPAPPPPLKRIPADANPTFEVATIKPTPEGTRFSIHPTRSGELVATDASLAYLIKFAYEVNPRQITKGPAWLDMDKYDLTAKPDIEGQPSLKQMRVMVQKLLADRFQLTFHREKIELPVYAVTVARGGPKLTVNDTNPNGNPGYGGGPAGASRELDHSGIYQLCSERRCWAAGGRSDRTRLGAVQLRPEVDARCFSISARTRPRAPLQTTRTRPRTSSPRCSSSWG